MKYLEQIGFAEPRIAATSRSVTVSAVHNPETLHASMRNTRSAFYLHRFTLHVGTQRICDLT